MADAPIDKRRKCIQDARKLNIAVNIFFVICGGLLIVVGSFLLKQLLDLSSLFKYTLPAALIVLGFMLAVVGIYGLVAANVENMKYLIAYFLTLFAIILCEFAVGGAAYSFSDTIPYKLETSWDGLTPQDRNQIQIDYSCCGWTDPTDLPGPNCVTNTTNNSTHNSTNVNSRSYNFETTYNTRSTPTPTPTAAPLPGCDVKLIALFNQAVYGVGTTIFVLATFQFLGLFSSFILWAAIIYDRYQTGQARLRELEEK